MVKFWQVLRSTYIWTAIATQLAIMYAVGLPMFLVTMPFDKTRRIGHWYAQMWGRGVLKINNRWSTEVLHPERIPKNRPMVVVSNHQGMGDIMMAFCLDLHFKWISKSTNFYVPFMSPAKQLEEKAVKGEQQEQALEAKRQAAMKKKH